MNSIKIIASGVYLPNTEVNNDELNIKYKLDENWIAKRTGIMKRWYETNNNIEQMAINSVIDLLQNIQSTYSEKNNCSNQLVTFEEADILKDENTTCTANTNIINTLNNRDIHVSNTIDTSKIGAIIVATTSTKKLMPGISNSVQKFLNIEKCICMDILAGCSGYINAFDLARKYICLGEAEYVLVIGVEQLSKYLDTDDLSTTIILGDGAGATLIGKSDNDKLYFQNIVSTTKDNDILTCDNFKKLYMNGKSVYKYATTKTVENVKEIMDKANVSIDEIKYIIPHQSNKRILDAITQRLQLPNDKVYSNIKYVGNTFCASIPIAINDMFKNNLLKTGDLVILLGYGGGLNLGSILIQI